MKKFAVAIYDCFTDVNKIYILEAKNDYEALKIAELENSQDKEDTKYWQERDDYPKNFLDFQGMLYSADIIIDVVKI